METTTQQKENDPARLLDGINQSIFLKALMISAGVHLIFVFGTSFGLYKDWATYGMTSENYGFHTPSVMKTIKRDLVAEQEEAERQKKLDERMAEQEKAAAEAAANETPEPEGEAEGEEKGEAATESDTPTPPEIEPMAPKENFSLDDMPGLSL